MIRTLYRKSDGTIREDVKLTEVPALLRRRGGLIWMDFESTDPAIDEPILTKTFRFHPLAVDDALRESHVPKVDDWDDYLYLVLHAVDYDPKTLEHLETVELDVFLGGNYIVTHHDQAIPALNRVWTACHRDSRFLARGADHLLYRILDDVVAAYMPMVEQIDENMEDLEDRIFDRPTPENLAELIALKRALLRLRRVIAPQREVLNKLARDEYAQIDPKGRIFFRDIYDHLVRLHDINETMRDLVGGALETYLSVINNRMNDIMKTLTVITTLFMPITFITGFFGMNFFSPVAESLHPSTSLPAFIAILALMLGTPLIMVAWLHRRGWM